MDALIGLLLFCATAFAFYALTQGGFAEYDVAEIQYGWTKKQVLDLWGKPEEVHDNEWTYTVPFKIYAAIHFDSDGKVARTYRTGPPTKREIRALQARP